MLASINSIICFFFPQESMFSSSAQARSWMFKKSSELNKLRENANSKFVKQHSKGMNVSMFYVDFTI